MRVAVDALVEVVAVASHLHQTIALHGPQLIPAQQPLARDAVVAELHQAPAGFQPAPHHGNDGRAVMALKDRERLGVNAGVAVIEAQQHRFGGQLAAPLCGQHLIEVHAVEPVGLQPGELAFKGLRTDGVIRHHGMGRIVDLVIRQHHQLTVGIRCGLPSGSCHWRGQGQQQGWKPQHRHGVAALVGRDVHRNQLSLRVDPRRATEAQSPRAAKFTNIAERP